MFSPGVSGHPQEVQAAKHPCSLLVPPHRRPLCLRTRLQHVRTGGSVHGEPRVSGDPTFVCPFTFTKAL